MSELKTNLQEILQEKHEKIIPENIKKDVQIFDVVGTLEGGTTTSGVKLFETEEEMQADSTAQEGDLAVVYREEIQNMTADTETQYISFPETVTLPEAFTDSVYGMLRAVDTSLMFDGQVQLNKTSFRFDGYSESGMIRIQYSSSDGITYTRTRFSGDSGDLINPVDLGTIVKYEPMEPWNDALGYFMQTGGMTFDGLYKYGNYPLEGTYCNSYNTNTELNSIPYLSPNISRPDEVGYDYNIIVVTDSHLDASGLYKVIDKCKVLWYGGGYGKDAVYNGKQGILVLLYDPSYAESSSTNLNLVLEEYDFTVSTNPTSKQIIRNWDDISIFPSPIYVAQVRSSSSDPYNEKWYFTSYENADYTGNGHAASYKHTIYSVPSDITLPISSTGYGRPEGITTKDDAYYYTNVYTNRYELAPNQYTLTESNQLLPNISAYGKNGNVTGDNSIYNNLDYNIVSDTMGIVLGEKFGTTKYPEYKPLKIQSIVKSDTGIVSPNLPLEVNTVSAIREYIINDDSTMGISYVYPLKNNLIVVICSKRDSNRSVAIYGYVFNYGTFEFIAKYKYTDAISIIANTDVIYNDNNMYLCYFGNRTDGICKINLDDGSAVSIHEYSTNIGYDVNACIRGNSIVMYGYDNNYGGTFTFDDINLDTFEITSKSYSHTKDRASYVGTPTIINNVMYITTENYVEPNYLYHLFRWDGINIKHESLTAWNNNCLTDGEFIYVADTSGYRKYDFALNLIDTVSENINLKSNWGLISFECTDIHNYNYVTSSQYADVINNELTFTLEARANHGSYASGMQSLFDYMFYYSSSIDKLIKYSWPIRVNIVDGIDKNMIGLIFATESMPYYIYLNTSTNNYAGTISPDEYNTALETAKDISGKEFYEIPYDYNTNLDIIKNVKVGDAIIARPLTNLLNPEIDNFSYNSNTGKSVTIYANDLGVANPSGYREYLEVTIRDTTGGNGFVGLQYIKKASEADIIYNSWTWKYVNQPLIDIGMYNMDMASGYDGPGWYDTAQYEWGTTYTKKTQEDIDVLIDYILRANLIVYNVNTWSNATEEESQQMNDILARIIQVDKKGE